MRNRNKQSQFSLLRYYKSRDWRVALRPVEFLPLKIKIACIILWDFYDEENKKCPYFLKKLSNLYNTYNVDEFANLIDESELFLQLRRIGYPLRLARKRSFYREIEIEDEKNN
tara:strand:+ start:47 stop:385 length:339 start_codon:yes stop_codon:yes gene_type:complete